MDSVINYLEKKEKALYIKAYRKGHSVIAIARSLGFDNKGRVYRVLRTFNEVPTLKTGQRFTLPAALDMTFAKMKLSFAQWCNSQKFDAKEAEIAINLGHWEVKKPEHRKILAALKADFHNLYIRLYKVGNDADLIYPKDWESPKMDLMVVWDDELEGYQATIPQLPDIVGYGKRWDAAIAELKYLYNVRRRILKLEELIKKPVRPISGL